MNVAVPDGAIRPIRERRGSAEMIFMAPDHGLPGVISALRREFPDSPLPDLERFAGAAWSAFSGVSHDEPGRMAATHWYARTLLLMERSTAELNHGEVADAFDLTRARRVKRKR